MLYAFRNASAHLARHRQALMPTAALIAIALLIFSAAPGYAFDLLGKQNTTLASNKANPLIAQASFLPEEQAFVFSYSLEDNQIELRWEMPDHYYLYQERFAFADTQRLPLNVFFSPAELKFDELFGRETLVHYNLAKVRLPLNADTPKQTITLQYQGCADTGLCYPPQTRTLLVDLAAMQISAKGISIE